MGEGRRRADEREEDKRTAEVRRYVDSLSDGQRRALHAELANRRNAQGNGRLDLEAIKGIVEGMAEADIAKFDALAEEELRGEAGDVCACGASATHRLQLAVWGLGQFKAIHKPAVIPVGGVFFCRPCGLDVPIPDSFKQAIDGQMQQLGEPLRDWSRADRMLLALDDEGEATDDPVYERPGPDDVLCAHEACHAMATHRPELTVPAKGYGPDEHDPARLSAAVWMCETHALGFLADMPEDVKQAITASIIGSGKVEPDWALATCQAIPAQMPARVN